MNNFQENNNQVLEKLQELEKKIDSQGQEISELKKTVSFLSPDPGVVEKSPGLDLEKLSVTERSREGSAPPPPPPAALGVKKESGEANWAKWIGIVGALMLFIGASVFFTFLFEEIWGDAGKAILGIIGGVLLLAGGQYFRGKYRVYSDIVMSAGLGFLYLSTFSSFFLYELINPLTTLFLFVAITALSFVISAYNATIVLSVIGILGAFLSPVLLGFQILSVSEFFYLFAYIAIVNAGVLAISVFRNWPSLNLLTILFTGLYFSSWLANHFGRGDFQEMFWGAFIFASIFFGIFLFSTIIHSIVRKTEAQQLNFVVAIINAAGYAAIVYFLLADIGQETWAGFVFLVLAVIYAVVSYMSHQYNPGDKVQAGFLLGIGIVFLTLVIPIQLSGFLITLAWLAQALVLIYLACLYNRRELHVFGIAIYFLGMLRLLFLEMGVRISDWMPVFNQRFFVFAFAVFVSFSALYLYHSFWQRIKREGSFNPKESNLVSFVVFLAIASSLLLPFTISMEINSFFDKKEYQANQVHQERLVEIERFSGERADELRREANTEIRAERNRVANQGQLALIFFWMIYAAAMVVVGFMFKVKFARMFGSILIFVVAGWLLIFVWGLGEGYQFLSLMGFGTLALAVSFVYYKYGQDILGQEKGNNN